MFKEKQRQPTDAALTAALGRTRRHWDALLEAVLGLDDRIVEAWKYYGASYGWILKLTQRRRAVLHLTPGDGAFLAALAYKDAALEEAKARGIPAALIAEIEAGKAWPEGRPIRITVTNLKQVALLKRLVAIKLET